jgi:hypothetical protein
MVSASYNNSVFINCPFDDGFKDLQYAMVFTVYRYGFIPRSALEEDNALENRLSKIEKIIRECKFGIHDISCTELNANGLPRFNMPFELGMFFGMKNYPDEHHRKVALLLERQPYLYQQYISDLSVVGITTHNNDPVLLIKIVRDWLQVSSNRKNIYGHPIIVKEYTRFRKTLPGYVKKLKLEIDSLTFVDYALIVNEFLQLEHGQ